MPSFGIRCSNTDFSYSILEGSKKAPILKEKHSINYPVGYSLPFSLKWFRQELIEIIKKNNVDVLVIKCSEGLAARNKTFVDRVSFEGIVLLASAETGIRNVSKKVKSTIAKDLGLKGRAKYLTTILDTKLIPGFEELTEKEKDATLAAWSELD